MYRFQKQQPLIHLHDVSSHPISPAANCHNLIMNPVSLASFSWLFPLIWMVWCWADDGPTGNKAMLSSILMEIFGFSNRNWEVQMRTEFVHKKEAFHSICAADKDRMTWIWIYLQNNIQMSLINVLIWIFTIHQPNSHRFDNNIPFHPK